MLLGWCKSNCDLAIKNHLKNGNYFCINLIVESLQEFWGAIICISHMWPLRCKKWSKLPELALLRRKQSWDSNQGLLIPNSTHQTSCTSIPSNLTFLIAEDIDIRKREVTKINSHFQACCGGCFFTSPIHACVYSPFLPGPILFPPLLSCQPLSSSLLSTFPSVIFSYTHQ